MVTMHWPLHASKPILGSMPVNQKLKRIAHPLHTLAFIMSFLESKAAEYIVTLEGEQPQHSG